MAIKPRREFLYTLSSILGAALMKSSVFSSQVVQRRKLLRTETTIYRSINGSPSENMEKVIDLLGCMKTIIGPDDIVVIKPNLQWWNQGAPNIASTEALINMIMHRPGGFNGEVVIAENSHRGLSPWNSAAWAVSFKRNSDIHGINNYNELSKHLKNKYGDRFSSRHWIDIKSGGKRVYSPEDGSGYVLCDGTGGVPLLSMDNGLTGKDHREVIMSYPIFQTDRGTIIDFKNGVWQKGSYSKQRFKYINLTALNHHSNYCGITSAVKNHLGISDLSGGANPEKGGKLTGNYYNFHSFPFNEWGAGPVPGMLGAEIGMFFNTIRKPDLNITTAEWIGLASRTELPVVKTRAVLASRDPVALDYHSAKYLVYPNSHIPKHNPDNTKGPLHIELQKCAQTANLVFDESLVEIISWDHKEKRLQTDNELTVYGEIEWGNNIKMLLKYILFRFGIV